MEVYIYIRFYHNHRVSAPLVDVSLKVDIFQYLIRIVELNQLYIKLAQNDSRGPTGEEFDWYSYHR